MCTVTIIRHPGGIRLACNRDEQRSRPAALPPRIAAFGPRRAILPIDPVGGGTWVAVSDAGLAFTLMNSYMGGPPPPPGEKSRGLIIPGLLPCGTLPDVLEVSRDFDAGEFAPFRLVVADERECLELAAEGKRLVLRSREPLTTPRFYASSGLGDRVVEGPRREVFEQFLLDGPATRQQQDALHRHRWPDRAHLSICMSRPEARTVSITCVEIDTDQVRLRYEPIDEAHVASQASEITLSLPRVATVPASN
jgi:hypothetical protein